MNTPAVLRAVIYVVCLGLGALAAAAVRLAFTGSE